MDDYFENYKKNKEHREKVAKLFDETEGAKLRSEWRIVSQEMDKLEEQEDPLHQDSINNPYHYTRGRVEAIDVIADAIAEAPNPMSGFLQGQVLKYMLRLWHKIDAKEDAEKAKWYLEKLISSL